MTSRGSTSSNGREPLLAVDALTVEYRRGRRQPALRAVDGVDLAIDDQQTVGLVGESGSGKSTIGRAILGLAPIAAGSVRFAGEDITRADARRRRALSTELQVIFQDPYSSLNPTRTIGKTLAEALHGQPPSTVQRRIEEMLERVGLPPSSAQRYPAQFSGGQRQRIAIARALMAGPRLVVCDEPVSALDLSVQAQVMNLLRELQEQLRLSYLFVAHDLAVVRHLSHRIVVLYRGRVMEQGGAGDVYRQPVHPYTRALLAAAPVPDPDRQRLRRQSAPKTGSESTAAPWSAGADACPFADRCPFVLEVCRATRPPLEPADDGRLVACHRWREIPPVAAGPSSGPHRDQRVPPSPTSQMTTARSSR